MSSVRYYEYGILVYALILELRKELGKTKNTIHKLKSQNIKHFYDGEKELSSALVSERPKI